MFLLVGLGNPGSKYQNNRHNVGFMAVDRIMDDYNFSSPKSKFNGILSEGRIGDEKAAILKPMTMMNNSGQSVGEAARFYKIPTDHIIVFYDDLDLPPGKIRVKQGGGHGGHNGLKSMDAHLSDKNYWRIRIGIGHPGHKDRVTGHVLGDFSKEEREAMLPDLLKNIADHTSLLLQNKSNDFMTKIAER